MAELRNVRARDAIKAFERAGGLVRQGRGDHVNIKMPNGQIITIPDSGRTVKIGILVSAIRKAGITPEEFAALVKD